MPSHSKSVGILGSMSWSLGVVCVLGGEEIVGSVKVVWRHVLGQCLLLGVGS